MIFDNRETVGFSR